MRSKLNLVLILIFGFISFSFGQETSFPKPVGFVNDFENLLSLEEVTRLETLLINYEKQTSNEIVIVTTNEIINEVDFDNYAVDLAKMGYW